jgi:uncharacterized protein
VRKDTKGKMLTVFIGEYDRYHHHSLADAILERARQEGLAGATILRGIEGFGPSGRLKTTRLLSSSDDLPILIQIIDGAHQIERFLPVLDRMISQGLVTMEDVDIEVYRENDFHPLDDD